MGLRECLLGLKGAELVLEYYTLHVFEDEILRQLQLGAGQSHVEVPLLKGDFAVPLLKGDFAVVDKTECPSRRSLQLWPSRESCCIDGFIVFKHQQ